MNGNNKNIRRIAVLHRILQQPKLKYVQADENKLEIHVNLPPFDLQHQFDVIFTQPALNFLSEIISTFDKQISQLYWNRLNKKIATNTSFNSPKFLDTPQRQNKTWKISPLSDRLICRHIDLGDVSPSNLNHLIESINKNVQGIQVDFDDGHCPSWRNQITGLYNVYCAIHGLTKGVQDVKSIPILMLRPRAWNMIEHNIMINGKKVPGAVVDFAILMYHNAQKLYESSSGPYFYLSKLESATEAKLWNDIFIWTQTKLSLPQGTIKACVLIENILSSFEMDEILYELREHSLGLNCGIWDYAASIINKFGDNPNYLLPDRNKYVNMDRTFLKKYMELVIKTCHARGAPATGGMAALLINDRNKSEVIEKIIKSKAKEINAGCDGFLIYDRNAIPYINKLWQSYPNATPNQFHVKLPNTIITEDELLKIPKGHVTLNGLRHNVAVAILYIYHWIKEQGHFFYKDAVEDSATAEISRSQIWQWIRHQAKIEDNNRYVTKDLIEQISIEFLKECEYYNNNNKYIILMAKELFIDIVTANYFIDFITSYLNDNCLIRNQQHI